MSLFRFFCVCDVIRIRSFLYSSVKMNQSFQDINYESLSRAEVSISNHAILAQFCRDHQVGLVVVGPEAPLAAGL